MQAVYLNVHLVPHSLITPSRRVSEVTISLLEFMEMQQ